MTLLMVDTILRGVIPLPQYGWKKLCKQIDLYKFPYNHTDILKEPNVRTIAQKIIDSMVDTENKVC
jgi:thioesterase domain-containing protein